MYGSIFICVNRIKKSLAFCISCTVAAVTHVYCSTLQYSVCHIHPSVALITLLFHLKEIKK